MAGLKAQLEDLTDQFEQKCREAEDAQANQENLAQHIEKLVAEVQREKANGKQLEDENDKLQRELDETARQSRRSLEAKESALQSALNDLARTQALLSQREIDLGAVQTALQTLEQESKKLGESHTTARFSLQLEVDRLKRDVERLEDELQRARKELDDRDGKGRDREGVLDKLHAENRDLAAQLAAQTQARLNVTEKLDGVQAALKTAEAEVATLRTKVSDLEQRLSKDQRTMLTAESQYRDQLTERNTLLLTIYQYMDKILGVDKTPVSHVSGLSCAFSCCCRRRTVPRRRSRSRTSPSSTTTSSAGSSSSARSSSTSTSASKRQRRSTAISSTTCASSLKVDGGSSTSSRRVSRLWRSIRLCGGRSSLRRRARWKRSRYVLSCSVVDANSRSLLIQTTNNELQSVISSGRKAGPGDSMEVRALTARAVNAEKRVTNLQNQLLAAEEKLTSVNQKTTVADNKWEIRVKEYEGRLRQAEEKVKRERQGGKERALELENQARFVHCVLSASIGY